MCCCSRFGQIVRRWSSRWKQREVCGAGYRCSLSSNVIVPDERAEESNWAYLLARRCCRRSHHEAIAHARFTTHHPGHLDHQLQHFKRAEGNAEGALEGRKISGSCRLMVGATQKVGHGSRWARVDSVGNPGGRGSGGRSRRQGAISLPNRTPGTGTGHTPAEPMLVRLRPISGAMISKCGTDDHQPCGTFCFSLS